MRGVPGGRRGFVGETWFPLRDGTAGMDAGRGGRGMSLAVAIFGLAMLILLHEAGHFFTARALNMRPRRFYVGFPPALLKTKRNGIEYGIGAIPLGGYVKIPGMHRPAPQDVDLHFGPALREEPGLVQVLGPVKRHLEAD